MFYYKLVDMNNLRLEERTVVENIYLILNQEWNYEEVEETKKMEEMFEDSEKIISRFMAIKEIDVKNKKIAALLNLSDEERRLAMIEEPEKWIEELEEKGEGLPFAEGFIKETARIKGGDNIERSDIINAAFIGIAAKAALSTSLKTLGADNDDLKSLYLRLDEAETEKIRALGIFVLKMAVYRFCTVHLPRITENSDQKTIDKIKVEMLENELEEWEKDFWIKKNSFEDYANIFMKRKELISHYSRKWTKTNSVYVLTCLEKAYKDDETFENVKELRLDYRRRNDDRNKKGQETTEIESMRKMLDIMEKQFNGELTTEEAGELKRHASEWSKDMQSLAEMISKLS